MYPAIPNLDHVVTQLVQFAVSDFDHLSERIPELVLCNIAFTASCFLHQHTNDTAGVDPDTVVTALKLNELMNYDSRLALVREMISDLNESSK